VTPDSSRVAVGSDAAPHGPCPQDASYAGLEAESVKAALGITVWRVRRRFRRLHSNTAAECRARLS